MLGLRYRARAIWGTRSPRRSRSTISLCRGVRSSRPGTEAGSGRAPKSGTTPVAATSRAMRRRWSSNSITRSPRASVTRRRRPVSKKPNRSGSPSTGPSTMRKRLHSRGTSRRRDVTATCRVVGIGFVDCPQHLGEVVRMDDVQERDGEVLQRMTAQRVVLRTGGFCSARRRDDEDGIGAVAGPLQDANPTTDIEVGAVAPAQPASRLIAVDYALGDDLERATGRVRLLGDREDVRAAEDVRLRPEQCGRARD